MKKEKKQQSQIVDEWTQPTKEVDIAVAGNTPATATNYLDILDRMKIVTGTKSDTAFARSIGLRQSSVSAAKERQSIPPAWAVQISEEYDVSLDWLMFGIGAPKRHGGAPVIKKGALPNEAMMDDHARKKAGYVEEKLNDIESSYEGKDLPLGDVENFDMGEVLSQTIDILNSKTVYTTAIVSNIKAFHKAITTEKKIDDLQDQLEESLASFQGQLDKTNQLVAQLHAENKQLRQELEQSRAQSTLSDTG